MRFTGLPVRMPGKARRKPPRHIEAAEQTAVVTWARARFLEDPVKWEGLDLLHASLNGVPLTPAQAGRMKGQGMRAGIPDLFLPVPRLHFHGLYIEMKSEGGTVSKEQREIVARLERFGYCVHVCYGYLQATTLIRRYYEAREWHTLNS